MNENDTCRHPEGNREAEVYTLHATGIAPDGIGPQYERRYYWIDRLATSDETGTGALRCAACGAYLAVRKVIRRRV
ncbi:MAG: hypothetical protein WC565_06760 [Parcubacteria group bacterium]